MLIAKGTTVAVTDGEKLTLYNNAGDERAQSSLNCRTAPLTARRGRAADTKVVRVTPIGPRPSKTDFQRGSCNTSTSRL